MKNQSQQLSLPPMTLGMKLAQAREAAGLSVEEAANSLRMRVPLVRAMEADDLSGFSHPSYARLSLLDYSRLMRIPIEEIRDWLPDIGGPSVDDCQYLNHYSDPAPAARRQDLFEQEKAARNPLATVFRIVLIVLILALLAYAWVLYIQLGRIGGANGAATGAQAEPQVEGEPAAAPDAPGLQQAVPVAEVAAPFPGAESGWKIDWHDAIEPAPAEQEGIFIGEDPAPDAAWIFDPDRSRETRAGTEVEPESEADQEPGDVTLPHATRVLPATLP